MPAVFFPALSHAGTPLKRPSDLTRLTLEELMDIQVTSVSKGEEDFSKAASAIFVLTQMDLRKDPISTDQNVAGFEGNDPEFQWNLRSHIDLPSNWEFDQMLYYVDALKSQQVRSYFRLDLRLGWRSAKNIEVSLVAQNLIDNQHHEWGVDRIQANDRNLVERSFFGKLVFKF